MPVCEASHCIAAKLQGAMEKSAREKTAPANHRERLLEAAITCLQTKGYARTTARDLVAASGTNLASIGYHFGSKEHLLNVAVTEAFRRWLEPVVALAAEASGDSPLERLQRSLLGVFDTLEENRALVTSCIEAWAQLEHAEDLRAEMSASYEDFHVVIARTTREAFAEIGVDEGIDAEALAFLFIAFFDGLLVRWQLRPDSMPSAERLIQAIAGALIALAGPRS